MKRDYRINSVVAAKRINNGFENRKNSINDVKDLVLIKNIAPKKKY